MKAARTLLWAIILLCAVVIILEAGASPAVGAQPTGSIGTVLETRKPPREPKLTNPPTDTQTTSSVSANDVKGNGFVAILIVLGATFVLFAYIHTNRRRDDD